MLRIWLVTSMLLIGTTVACTTSPSPTPTTKKIIINATKVHYDRFVITELNRSAKVVQFSPATVQTLNLDPGDYDVYAAGKSFSFKVTDMGAISIDSSLDSIMTVSGSQKNELIVTGREVMLDATKVGGPFNTPTKKDEGKLKLLEYKQKFTTATFRLLPGEHVVQQGSALVSSFSFNIDADKGVVTYKPALDGSGKKTGFLSGNKTKKLVFEGYPVWFDMRKASDKGYVQVLTMNPEKSEKGTQLVYLLPVRAQFGIQLPEGHISAYYPGIQLDDKGIILAGTPGADYYKIEQDGHLREFRAKRKLPVNLININTATEASLRAVPEIKSNPNNIAKLIVDERKKNGLFESVNALESRITEIKADYLEKIRPYLTARIDIYKATEAEIASLPNMTPATAKAIVAARKSNKSLAMLRTNASVASLLDYIVPAVDINTADKQDISDALDLDMKIVDQIALGRPWKDINELKILSSLDKEVLDRIQPYLRF